MDIRELDTIVLAHDIENKNLCVNDIGVVVHCYANGEAYEVEFVKGEGDTVAVLTLDRADIRPMRASEIMSVRELAV